MCLKYVHHPILPRMLPTAQLQPPPTYPHHVCEQPCMLMCACVQDRAIARLATEREVKELQQQHEEKLKMYRQKEREINEACDIVDNRIKELQERVRAGSGRPD